jgi:DNA-binding SARP family transcriptional activator
MAAVWTRQWGVMVSIQDLDQRHPDGARGALHLLGDLRLESGAGVVPLPEGSKRLLVLLALNRRRLDRRWAAGVLWPDGSDDRAAGNLRSSIWRLRRAGIDVIDADRVCLKLADTLDVDVDLVDRWAGRVVDGTTCAADLRVHPDSVEALDLLPGWYDEWVVMSRERLRHRVLHAFEALSRTLSGRGRHYEAIEAAILAAQLEPLRDSAQRALIRAHLAEGNWIEGQRSCRVYVDLLRSELGIEPHPDLMAVLARPWAFCAQANPADLRAAAVPQETAS